MYKIYFQNTGITDLLERKGFYIIISLRFFRKPKCKVFFHILTYTHNSLILSKLAVRGALNGKKKKENDSENMTYFQRE